MIVPDVNLLVYAYHEDDPNHEAARRWWEGLINGSERVGIPWVVLVGFVRVMSSPMILKSPMSPAAATANVERWFQYDQINPISPGTGHLAHFRRSFDAAGSDAKLGSYAHIAALALERQAIVHTDDSDLCRFPGLQWHNPL